MKKEYKLKSIQIVQMSDKTYMFAVTKDGSLLLGNYDEKGNMEWEVKNPRLLFSKKR